MNGEKTSSWWLLKFHQFQHQRNCNSRVSVNQVIITYTYTATEAYQRSGENKTADEEINEMKLIHLPFPWHEYSCRTHFVSREIRCLWFTSRTYSASRFTERFWILVLMIFSLPDSVEVVEQKTCYSFEKRHECMTGTWHVSVTKEKYQRWGNRKVPGYAREAGKVNVKHNHSDEKGNEEREDRQSSDPIPFFNLLVFFPRLKSWILFIFKSNVETERIIISHQD